MRQLKKKLKCFPPRFFFKMVYLTNSGSEANDLAMLMARFHTGNHDIITLRYKPLYSLEELLKRDLVNYLVKWDSLIRVDVSPKVGSLNSSVFKSFLKIGMDSTGCFVFCKDCVKNLKHKSQYHLVFTKRKHLFGNKRTDIPNEIKEKG